MLSGLFYAGLVAVIGGQMWRIPGVPVTAVYEQLVSGPFACLTFFHSGPLGWNGFVVFWIPAVVFTVWFIVNVTLLDRAVTQRC